MKSPEPGSLNRTTFCGREDDLGHLRSIWRDVVTSNEPRIVAVLAESGVGKTRLVQEFYAWLAQTHRSPEGEGYWPARLDQNEQNLVVNPELADTDTTQVMPFLWWGVRLTDPSGRNQVARGAVASHVGALIPHLEPMYHARRGKQRWIEGGKIVGNAALGFIPVVGELIGSGQTIFELDKLRRESREDREASAHEAEERAVRDLHDRILDDLSRLFRPRRRDATIPMVWVLDDAHFSVADPAVVDLFAATIDRAEKESWPVLILMTHWEREWHGQKVDETRPSIARALVAGYRRNHREWRPYPLRPIVDQALAPILEESLPGLTSEQRAQLLERADGNPRFLEEIVRLCLARPRYFVDRDPQKPFMDKGLKTVLEATTNLHDLVEARLQEAPGGVRDLVTLSSLQGVRLLHVVSARLLERLTAEGHDVEAPEDRRSLELARTPYAFLNLLGGQLAEFSQRVFYEVARGRIEDIVDQDEALEALMHVLHEMYGEWKSLGLSADERELLMQLTADLLAHSDDPEVRCAALVANVRLIAVAQSRDDTRAALHLAELVLEGQERNLWALDALEFDQLWSIHDAFRSMDRLGAARTLVQAMRQAAETENNQSGLGLALSLLGEIHRDRGDMDGAMEHFTASLRIREQLAGAEGTPRAERSLSITRAAVGDIHLMRGELDEALNYHEPNLELVRELAERTLKTTYARQSLAIAYDRLGEIGKRKGEIDAAVELFRKGLEIGRALVDEAPDPSSQRTLSVSHNHLGDIHRDRGETDEALRHYQASLRLREEIDEKLGSPESKRDLGVCRDRVGDIHKARGEYDAALECYEAALAVTRDLAETSQTASWKRDLVVSYSKFAELYEEQGRRDDLHRVLLLGLAAAEDYRTVMPYEDARELVSWFRERLDAFGGRPGPSTLR